MYRPYFLSLWLGAALLVPVANLPAFQPIPHLANKPALLRIQVPADAHLTIDDTATAQTGPLRTFETPPLSPGAVYTYILKVTWRDHEANVVMERAVDVKAGQTVAVDLRPGVRTASAEVPVDKLTKLSQFIQDGIVSFHKNPKDPAAMEAFTQAIEQDQKSARAYADRALARMARGRSAQLALEDANQAIRLDPKLTLGFEARIHILSRVDRQRPWKNEHAGQAIADCTRIIELEPKQAKHYYRRAVVYILAENYARAIEDLNKSIELDVHSGAAYYLRSRAHFELGDTELAQADEKKAFEAAPALKQAFYRNGKRVSFEIMPLALPR